MALSAGQYTLGPDDGTLSVHTKRGGAIAKAGHDLLIRVTSWNATLDVGEGGALTAIELTADSTSMNVLEGTGGMTSLGEDDKTGIAQTINEEILKASPIAFRSTAITPDGDGRSRVSGELELVGTTRATSFMLTIDRERITGAATITQSNWGIKPYTALFGTLKVLDDVTIEVDAQVPASAAAH